MEQLNPTDARLLSFALGWIGLGNLWEANQELAALSPSVWAHPDVLFVRHEMYIKSGRWTLAADIAVLITHFKPRDPEKWIALAHAALLKPGNGLPEARQILAKAHDLFPGEALIAYRLSCLECRSGNLSQARAWLDKAFSVGSQKMLTMMALVETDLQPLLDIN